MAKFVVPQDTFSRVPASAALHVVFFSLDPAHDRYRHHIRNLCHWSWGRRRRRRRRKRRRRRRSDPHRLRGPAAVKVTLGYAPTRNYIVVARLAQDQGQPPDIRRQQNLLCLLRRHLNCDRLGNGRVLLPLARELVDRKHLHMVQKNVGVALALGRRASLISTTSTKSRGRMKPATPRTSSTRTVTARFPGSSSVESDAR